MIRAVAAAVVLLLAGCTSYRDRDVAMTTQAIDPAAYAGLWYEIARFPVRFQRGCTATTAEYGVIDADTLSVVNTCRQGAPDGLERGIAGTADLVGPGKLRVRLGAIPFAADYWVLWVDEGYDTAVVGVPSGRAGWILARSADVPPDRMATARAVLSENGYDLDALIMTEHAPR